MYLCMAYTSMSICVHNEYNEACLQIWLSSCMYPFSHRCVHMYLDCTVRCFHICACVQYCRYSSRQNRQAYNDMHIEIYAADIEYCCTQDLRMLLRHVDMGSCSCVYTQANCVVRRESVYYINSVFTCCHNFRMCGICKDSY